MKRIPMLISAAALLSAPLTLLAQEEPAGEAVVNVPFGTIVMATLEEGLSTVAKARKAEAKGLRQVKAGDTVIARVTEDVTLGGRVVIAAGAPVTLRVGSETKKNRRMGRKGLLVLDAVMVQAVDGKAIPLDGRIDSEGAGRIGTTVGLTYALGPLGLLKKGKAAELPAGGVYQVMVMGQTEVTVAEPGG
ncbi:MAG: hypothetical protein OXU63_14305 [Acidobacteriota bacterium]|nr:hypothetical protein [Acidobacteriota bacterium]